MLTCMPINDYVMLCMVFVLSFYIPVSPFQESLDNERVWEGEQTFC